MSASDITNKLWNYFHVLRDDGRSYGDYVEQLTYLLFLKMSDERTQAPYHQPSIVPQQYSWSSLIKKDGDELFEQFSGSRCPALARKPSPRLLPRAFGGNEVHWTSLFFRLTHHALDALGKEKGLLGLIFNKAQNKFQDPAKLRRLLVDLMDKENWSVMSADEKGDAYEGLLEKNAQNTKSGAGQYSARASCFALPPPSMESFTPRARIDSARPWASASGRASRVQFRSWRNCQAMVDAMVPEPGETIADPACGTGGFLLAAHQYLVDNYPNMTKPQKKALKSETFKGWELVQSTARLCAMNMLLHGIGDREYEPIVLGDSLAADPGDRFDLILATPPFGKKSGTTIVAEVAPAIHGSRDIGASMHGRRKVSKERDTVERDDFWATTSNKQLTNSSGTNLNSRFLAGPEGVSLRDETNSFVQHIKTLLKVNGRAAVVVPDNVRFEGGAGETIRRKLLHECDVHTLLSPSSLRIPCSARRPGAHHPWRARSPGRRFTGPSPSPAHPAGLFYAQGVAAPAHPCARGIRASCTSRVNALFFDKKPACETPWTRKLWIYDLRTNMHFTLKTNPLKRGDSDDFVACYFGENRGGGAAPTKGRLGAGRLGRAEASDDFDDRGFGLDRGGGAAPTGGNTRSGRFNRKATWSDEKPGGRWRAYDYEELVNRDKASLDIFWLKDESLEDSKNLPPPDVLAQEIVDDLEAVLEQFREIAEDLNGAAVENEAG